MSGLKAHTPSLVQMTQPTLPPFFDGGKSVTYNTGSSAGHKGRASPWGDRGALGRRAGGTRGGWAVQRRERLGRRYAPAILGGQGLCRRYALRPGNCLPCHAAPQATSFVAPHPKGTPPLWPARALVPRGQGVAARFFHAEARLADSTTNASSTGSDPSDSCSRRIKHSSLHFAKRF